MVNIAPQLLSYRANIVEEDIKKILIQSYPILLDMIPNQLLKIDSLSLFNPSIAEDVDKLFFLARESSHPIRLEKDYTKVLKSNLKDINHIFILSGDRFHHAGLLDDQVLANQFKSEYHGLHDIRLFKLENQIWGLGGMLLSREPKSLMRQVLFRLNENKVTQPLILDSPFGFQVEKNWMPVVKGGKLFFVYSLDPFVLLELSNKKIIVQGQVKESKDIKLFGNTAFVKYKDIFIGLAHQPRILIDKYYYLHCFVVLNDQLEFIEKSQPFFIMRRGVEFASGLLLQEEKMHITFGVADRAACMATINILDLKKFIHSVN